MEYSTINVISGKGTGREQFRTSLTSITIGPDGDLYVVGDRQVKVFDTETGKLKRQWPTVRNGRSIAVDDQRRVFVGEAAQIEIFDSVGKRLNLWNNSHQLGLVTAIGLDAESIFVADAKNRCIRRYSKDRRHRNDIGIDNRPTGFVIPNGHLDFGLDAEGVVHVAHSGKHRVERYSPTGELLGQFGKFGMRDPANFRGCCNPTNVAVTKDGRVVVTEKAGPRAKVFDADGDLLAVMGEEFFDPNCRNMDVTVGRQGDLYVVDTVRLQIHVFRPTSEKVADRPVWGIAEGVVRV